MWSLLVNLVFGGLTVCPLELHRASSDMGYEDKAIAPADRSIVVDYGQMVGLRKFMNLPFGFSMEDEIRQGEQIWVALHQFGF